LTVVSDPAGTPSANVYSSFVLSVQQTDYPVPVKHQGNTGGINGYLEALDDRLTAAVLRNGSIWTTQTTGINAPVNGPAQNNAVRWYEITYSNLNGSNVRQSGTIAGSLQEFYWMPAITVSGQGNVLLGFNRAGVSEY